MTVDEHAWKRWFGASAFLASVAGFVSIAASHACLGLAAALLLLRRQAARMPPIGWPLAAFMLWTLASAAASPDPAAAAPQIRKFFVFLMVPVVAAAFRSADSSRKLAEAWFVAAAAAVSVGVFQFIRAAQRISASGLDFTEAYVSDRITGFFSHWMTFSQAVLLVFAALVSYLVFAERRPGRGVWLFAAAWLASGLALSYTRSVWLALVGVCLYFIAVRKPRALLPAPLVLAAGLYLAPRSIQERAASINVAANPARIVMWRTGLRMIAAHPLFGVGPQQVGPRFSEFQPEDVTELPPAYYGHLHNVYIHYAAERGIPAALIVVWLLAKIVVDLTRALRSQPRLDGDRRFLLHAGIAGTLAAAAVSCFDLSLGDSEVLGVYLGLVALAYNGAVPPESNRQGQRAAGGERL